MQRLIAKTGTHTLVTDNVLRDPLSALMFNGLFATPSLSGKMQLLNRAWIEQSHTVPLDYKQLLCFKLDRKHDLKTSFQSMEILSNNEHFKVAMARFKKNEKKQLSLWERLYFTDHFHHLTLKYMDSKDALSAIILLESQYAKALVRKIGEPDSLQPIVDNENPDWAKLLNVLLCRDLTQVKPDEIHNALQNVVTQSSMTNTLEDELFIQRLFDSIYSSLYAIAKDPINFKRHASNVYKNLPQIDLSGSQSDLNGVQLSNSYCRYASFNDAKLVGANLIGTYLKDATLQKADLSRAQLMLAELDFTDLSDAILDEADLTQANIVNSNMQNTRLHGAKFTQAYLSNISFANAQLSKALFSNSRWSLVDFTAANLQEADLSEAEMSCPNAPIFARANLESTNLSLCKFPNANFTDANLTNANLNRSDLHLSRFYRTNLSNADLSFTLLCGTSFREAVLDNTNFKHAILIGAKLDENTRDYAKKHGAILTMTDLANAYKSGQISFTLRFLENLISIATGINISGVSSSLSDLIKAIELYVNYELDPKTQISFAILVNPYIKEREEIRELLAGLYLLKKYKPREEQTEHTAPTMHWNKL